MGRKPAIPGEEEFLGKGVSYCAVCDAAFYKNQQVCVIGDSEEAIKEAGFLAGFAKTVYLIAPSKELNIQQYETELNPDTVTIIPGHRVISINGDDFVTKIRIKNVETAEEQELPMDGVFVYLYGTQPVVDFLFSSLSLSDKSCIVTHRTMETSVPGVFAAGDVSCSEVRQVVIAAAFGSMAALSAEKFIRHRKRAKYDWLKS
jgi:thioredoxin reductase (NADPH)